MKDLIIPRDAFSHGQIRSKLWLSENFAQWSEKYINADQSYDLSWYGSWVGLGPFLLLGRTGLKFDKINLFDLNQDHLETSKCILDFWRCESIEITTQTVDVNQHQPEKKCNQIFVNSSCEHMTDNSWLENIPSNCFVLLQSTNMPHTEHINCSLSADDFISKYKSQLNILESTQIDFSYPDKVFSRFMLFGIKK